MLKDVNLLFFLTSDVCLWGYMKGQVYVPLPANNLGRESLPHYRLLCKTCCNVFGRSWSTELTCVVSLAECILNMCEIGYDIHISLNFSL